MEPQDPPAVYDAAGSRSPRRDRPARDALEQAARLFSQQPDPPPEPAQVAKLAKAAIDAGCDDPMVGYIYTRLDNVRQDDAKLRTRMNKVAEDLRMGRYPAMRKAAALRFAAGAMPPEQASPADRKAFDREYEACIALLAVGVKTDVRTPMWEDTWFDVLESVIRGYRRLGVGVAPVAAHGRVDARLAKIPELKAMRLQLRGAFFLARE